MTNSGCLVKNHKIYFAYARIASFILLFVNHWRLCWALKFLLCCPIKNVRSNVLNRKKRPYDQYASIFTTMAADFCSDLVKIITQSWIEIRKPISIRINHESIKCYATTSGEKNICARVLAKSCWTSSIKKVISGLCNVSQWEHRISCVIFLSKWQLQGSRHFRLVAEMFVVVCVSKFFSTVQHFWCVFFCHWEFEDFCDVCGNIFL